MAAHGLMFSFIYVMSSLLFCFINSQGKPEIWRHCRSTCYSIQYNLSLDFHILVFQMSLTLYVHLNPLCLIINCWWIENYIHRHLVSVITQQELSTWINYPWYKNISPRIFGTGGSKCHECQWYKKTSVLHGDTSSKILPFTFTCNKK